MAPAQDVVYALHDFEAENEDELSFSLGEVIVVLERDDQYGDGWFSGRNTRGEVGLFPQSYTSVDRPEMDEPSRANGAHTPLDALVANSSEVDQALQRLGVDNADRVSVRSRASRQDSDEDHSAPSQNHRANLAARAVAEVAAAQRAKEEAAATRRRADEEAYRNSGLVDGLQLSDESDEDDVAGSLIPPKLEKRPSISEVIQPAAPARGPAPEPAAPVSANTSPLLPVGGEPLTKQKSRADTIASSYAESTYSNQSPPPVPAIDRERSGSISGAAADYQALAAEPALHYSALNDDAKEELSPNLNGTSPRLDVPEGPTASDVESTPVPPTSATLGPGHTAEVIVGAGLTGIAAAAAAVAHPFTSGGSKQAEPTPEAPAPVAAAPAEAAINGHTNGVQTLATPAVPATRALTPPPPPLDTRASTLAGAGPATLSSPARSASRASSPGFRTGASVASTNEASAGLPFDPLTWGVDEVVQWASGKGFDELTISKFREHEISGDVLLELDVAMLKEIDLPAFGRRVHIYNAIKELKLRVSPPSAHSSTRPTSILSPGGLSGYEVDSPATALSYTTPLPAGSFASPTSQTGFAQWPTRRSEGDVQGLGFEDDSRSSQAARPMRARAAIVAAGGHMRSSTAGTENSFGSNGVTTLQIAEEGEDVELNHSNTSIPSVESRAGPSRARKASSRLSIRGKSTDERSSMSGPSSPNPSILAKTPKQDQRASFFGATLGRSRKPPPRVPSQSSVATSTEFQGAQPRPRQSLQNNASKRATRLFSSFGSSGEKSPILSNRKSMASGGLTTREGPSSMTPKSVDEAGEAMLRQEQQDAKAGDLMDKIGTPDFSGWMQKKGEKYNGWKQRFLVLKGVHLYWLKSESEQRIKGFINLTGFRIISDPDIHPGHFGFKIVHDTERAHHFSAAEQVTVRNWMKEIMKATIGRDYSAPVLSSCDVDSLPLKVAQQMSPRPPSPTQRSQIQRQRYAGTNPNTLSPKDAQILMEFAPGSPLMTSPKLGPASPSLGGAGSRLSMMVFPGKPMSPSPSSGLIKSLTVDDVDRANEAVAPTPASPTQEGQAKDDLLDWVNEHLPPSVDVIGDLSLSLRSGRVLVRLLEELSGEASGISEADFASYRAPGAGGDWDATYFDTVFNVFDFISPIVSTDGIAMDDMLRGNGPLLAMLLERYRQKFA